MSSGRRSIPIHDGIRAGGDDHGKVALGGASDVTGALRGFVHRSLEREAQGTFGGLLKWFWPWAIGDGGLLGRITTCGFPVAGSFIAVTTAGVSILAALAVIGIWIPLGWWRVLAMGGAVLSLLLMVALFGVTKLLPMALDLVVLWAAITNGLLAPST
jgi:hypothetical protein